MNEPLASTDVPDLLDDPATPTRLLHATLASLEEARGLPAEEEAALYAEHGRSILLNLRHVAGNALLALMKELARVHLTTEQTPDGWAPDLEFRLWRTVVEGAETLTEDVVNELEDLSELAGGWWLWTPAVDEVAFMPLEGWREEYARYVRRGHTTQRSVDLAARVKALEAELAAKAGAT